MSTLKWSIENKTMAGFGLVLALFAGSLAVAFQSVQYLQETNSLVLHTQKVLREIDGTIASVTSAESGQRGYVLTGDATYLEPYNTAQLDLQQHLSQLGALLVDNPAQQTRLASLDSLITTRMDTISKSIDAYTQEGFNAAQEIVLSGQGKDQMQSLRNLAAEMQSEENTLLQQRSAASEESRKQSGRTFLLLVIMVVAMLGFVYYLIRRDSKQRRRAEMEIKKLNTDLEQRVSERTSQLETANRDLQLEVAERAHTERVLTVSEGRFNAFMDNSPALAWLKDDKGYFVYANRTFLHDNNLSMEELGKKTAYDLWPEDVAAYITQSDQAVLTWVIRPTKSTLDNSTPENGAPGHLLTSGSR